MNKILVVVSFVFVSFLSCTGLTDRQRLANQILSDTNLLKVDSMARATIRNGFSAGSGYSQIWARDMNTFVEIAFARRVIHTNCGKLSYCFSLFNSRMMR